MNARKTDHPSGTHKAADPHSWVFAPRCLRLALRSGLCPHLGSRGRGQGCEPQECNPRSRRRGVVSAETLAWTRHGARHLQGALFALKPLVRVATIDAAHMRSGALRSPSPGTALAQPQVVGEAALFGRPNRSGIRMHRIDQVIALLRDHHGRNIEDGGRLGQSPV